MDVAGSMVAALQPDNHTKAASFLRGHYEIINRHQQPALRDRLPHRRDHDRKYAMHDTIRSLIAQTARLPIGLEKISDDDDLYAAGLTSFAAVQLMLAIEDSFDIEFPETMLNRRSFTSVDAIAGCLHDLGVSMRTLDTEPQQIVAISRTIGVMPTDFSRD